MNKCRYETYHKFFLNLANPLKIQIIVNLRDKDKCVGTLSEELRVEQSKISHALTSLKNCNIVKVKREGKHRVYSLNTKTIEPMLNLIDKHASTECKNCPFRNSK